MGFVMGQFNECYLPQVDGVVMVVQNYARLLNASYGLCCVVTAHYPGYEDRDPFDVIRYSSVPVPGTPYRTGLPSLDPRCVKRLRSCSFNILHSHSPFFSGLSALHIAKRRRIPIVTTFHSKYYDDFKAALHSQRMAEMGVDAIIQYYNRVDSVWTVNRSTANTLRDYGFKGDIEIMPNGTEFTPPSDPDSLRSRVEQDFSLGKDEILLLFVGRLVWTKNLKILAKSLQLLKQAGTPFRMIFAGSGDAEAGLKELVETLGLNDRVHMPGAIKDREYLKGLYTRADLFVFPSLYDNDSLVVKEAAACQCPSLLIAGSNAAERVTDGQNGFLCENTPESIARALQQLLDHPGKLREAGVEAAKTLYVPWDRIIGKVYQRYAELVTQKAGQPSRYKSLRRSRVSSGE
ncbi:MAG TPA: glycosyl transferase [Clostridiales bacterium]|nr:glycosyl transferase [Clostridiales bacterium]